MGDNGKRVLVIVPAFNEEAALPGCVAALSAAVPDADVLLVNDGSLDRTGAVARDLAAAANRRVVCVDLPLNCGIGAGVQTGLTYAHRHGYEWAVQFDGDGQHDAGCIPAMLQQAAAGELELCIGSRFLHLDSDQFRSTPLRRLGIRFFAALIGLLTGQHVTDPTSGFRVYGRRAIAFFSEHYPDDYPEPEALFWCIRSGLRIAEVPVRMHPRGGGTSSIRYWRTGYYMAKVTLAILVDRLRSTEHIRAGQS